MDFQKETLALTLLFLLSSAQEAALPSLGMSKEIRHLKMNRTALSPVLREFWMHGLDGLHADDFITHCGTTVSSGRRGPLEFSRGLGARKSSVDHYCATRSPAT